MHPLRILQIVPSLVRETGGPTRSVPALGKALTELGHTVVLYTTTWPVFGNHVKSSADPKKNFGYEVVTFPAQRNLFFPNIPYSPPLVQAVCKHGHEFDIVHVFSLWNPVASFSLRALRRMDSVYCLSPLGMLDPVVLRRNRWKKLPWLFFWERANIEKAAFIHFTASLEEEMARGSWELNRTVVVPQVVDLEKWKALPDRSVLESRFPQLQKREVILFVGRINWVKNLDLLLNALAGVLSERPRAMLVCVGPDSDGYQAVLEKQARTLGIENHVLFTGMLEGDYLKSAYARADVLALISQKENFGHAAAEALACGIPVVLSTGVGIGSDWPASSAMFRVKPVPEQITTALVSALERSSVTGLPDPEARSLAETHLGTFPGARIADAYHSVLS
jgi:glycosyltransferase involved in cell wall biosynthesis